MKASNDLFDLIKSLGGAEKGYFKKHSAIKSASDKNYLMLFYNSSKCEMHYAHITNIHMRAHAHKYT